MYSFDSKSLRHWTLQVCPVCLVLNHPGILGSGCKQVRKNDGEEDLVSRERYIDYKRVMKLCKSTNFLKIMVIFTLTRPLYLVFWYLFVGYEEDGEWMTPWIRKYQVPRLKRIDIQVLSREWTGDLKVILLLYPIQLTWTDKFLLVNGMKNIDVVTSTRSSLYYYLSTKSANIEWCWIKKGERHMEKRGGMELKKGV